jgi:hypothetical protein
MPGKAQGNRICISGDCTQTYPLFIPAKAGVTGNSDAIALQKGFVNYYFHSCQRMTRKGFTMFL